MTRRPSITGPSLWRLSGRARDQHGHGGGSGGAGGRRSASSSHPPDGRTRCGDGPRRLPSRRGFRPTSSRSSTTWDGSSRQADLIVCRAGATTLAEITAAGKAAILIPLPTATDDHQRKNAEALAAAGAAEVLLQTDVTGPVLAERILALAGDRERRDADGRARRATLRAGRDAARVIVDRALGSRVSRDRPAEAERRRRAGVLGKTRRVHFIGIGGIGMSGIAELLANLGYVVTGSDEKRSAVTDRLATLGDSRRRTATTPRTSATPTSWWSRRRCGRRTRRCVEAARRQIPVIPRAEMLAELMRLRYAIAVAGAHGKTTTTSMIALVLERAGLDPTAVIGGRLSAFGSNARLGRGELMVAEADESDRSFLKLFPTIAVITNIDHEHLENYGGFDDLQQAFVDFANKVPFYGAVVALRRRSDTWRRSLPRMTRRVITYGLDVRDARRRRRPTSCSVR